MDEPLLGKAAEQMRAVGFEKAGAVEDQLEDKGVTYLAFSGPDHDYFVRAKDYLYENNVPFGKEMVAHARREGALLVIYYDDLEECYVAHPDFVDRHGSEAAGQSRRSKSRPWVEIDLEHAVVLEDHVEGEDPPKTMARAENTEDTALEDFL